MFQVLTTLSLILLSLFVVQVVSLDDDIDDYFNESMDPDLRIPSHDESRYVEVGDMLLTPEQHDYLYTNDSLRRHGFREEFQLWPDGIVPVVISEDFDPDYVDLIISAMDYISNVSCVVFNILPVPPSKHHVKIFKDDVCSSLVGRVEGGEQLLKIGDYCKKGNIIHELLHVLGFLHMHTAVSRDDFVRINWQNIADYAFKNFERVTASVSMFDTQYDYRSIMHYTSKAFAIDDKVRTIIPFERVTEMGQRERMSDGDITRVNRMYKCNKFIEEEDYDSINEKLKSEENVEEIKQVEAHPSENSPELVIVHVQVPEADSESDFEDESIPKGHRQQPNQEFNKIVKEMNVRTESNDPLTTLQNKLIEIF